MLLVYTLDVTFQDNYKMYIRPHSYGMRPDVHGISLGLNKRARWCRPFDSFLGSTKKIAARRRLIYGGAEGQPVLTTKLSKDYIYSFRGDTWSFS